MHLLSESAIWATESEFTDAAGKCSIGKGESRIEVAGVRVINTSWVEMEDGKRILNVYDIEKVQDNLYHYRSTNPALGIQTGSFCIDKNIVYSKFSIIDTQLSGFESIVRDNDICHAYGALYDNDKLINTWTTTMQKI